MDWGSNPCYLEEMSKLIKEFLDSLKEYETPKPPKFELETKIQMMARLAVVSAVPQSVQVSDVFSGRESPNLKVTFRDSKLNLNGWFAFKVLQSQEVEIACEIMKREPEQGLKTDSQKILVKFERMDIPFVKQLLSHTISELYTKTLHNVLGTNNMKQKMKPSLSVTGEAKNNKFSSVLFENDSVENKQYQKLFDIALEGTQWVATSFQNPWKNYWTANIEPSHEVKNHRDFKVKSAEWSNYDETDSTPTSDDLYHDDKSVRGRIELMKQKDGSYTLDFYPGFKQTVTVSSPEEIVLAIRKHLDLLKNGKMAQVSEASVMPTDDYSSPNDQYVAHKEKQKNKREGEQGYDHTSDFLNSLSTPNRTTTNPGRRF